MTLVEPIPKPQWPVKAKRSIVTPEQYERVKRRTKGICEACEHPFLHSDPIHLHHLFGKGMGGRPYYKPPDWELIGIHFSCHRKEESEGYRHAQEWADKIKTKMGVVE